MGAITPLSEMILPVARRAWSERAQPQTRNGRSNRSTGPKWPASVLVFDTETTVDELQNLTFGTYRYCRWRRSKNQSRLDCVEEGIFHADNLEEANPTGYQTLVDYAQAKPASVVAGQSTTLRLLSRRQFLDSVFYPAAIKARALIVGFNLPFDLSRLAVDWTAARGSYAGGFSLVLWDYYDETTDTWRANAFRPRVLINTIDSKRALIGFGGTRDAEKDTYRGRFLDCRTLAFVLSDRGHSLESACNTFGVPVGKLAVSEHGIITPEYIDYARQDTAATSGLLEKLRAEYDRHPIDLDPCRALSPASLAKQYLGAMGVRPPLERWPEFPRSHLGQAMSAYYGGRAECRVRRTPVPVVYCDFLSMYPTVNTLLRTWRLLTAADVSVIDATDDVRRLLAALSPDDVLEPDCWAGLVGYAEIVPNGDVLPVRAAYDGDGGTLSIGVNYYYDDTPRWYALPDVVAATLLTGRPPEIRQAWRLVPSGTLAGLRPINLGGAVLVDPSSGDFFRTVIEQRQRVKRDLDIPPEERRRLDKFLKVIANSGSYGIFAEFTKKILPKNKSAALNVASDNDRFPIRTSTVEDAGKYCFPPIAACITAGARLMLAVLERLVSDAGGTYAFCDTDSFAIVASETGGPVPCPNGGSGMIQALSWQDVAAIVARFERSNPYDRTVVTGSVLKVEAENYVDDDPSRARRQLWCYAVSAKRYVLYTLDNGARTIRKRSEHGLGHLQAPATNWTYDMWECVLQGALDSATPATGPAWLDTLAVQRLTATSPTLLAPFKPIRKKTTPRKQRPQSGETYQASVTPFNFLLAAQPRFGALSIPAGVCASRFRLVRPYEMNPRKWGSGWRNVYDDQRYRVSTVHSYLASDDTVTGKTYRDVLDSYGVHPERKSADADGKPCDRGTKGLLQRRTVHAGRVLVIGKEAHRLDSVEAQWENAVGIECFDAGSAALWNAEIVPLLQTMPIRTLAQQTGLSKSTLEALIHGRSMPRATTRRRLTALARRIAHDRLDGGVPDRVAASLEMTATPSEAKALSADDVAHLRMARAVSPLCAGCAAPLSGRRRQWCSERCRKRAYRGRSPETAHDGTVTDVRAHRARPPGARAACALTTAASARASSTLGLRTGR